MKNTFNRNYLQRDHQKIIMSEKKLLLGSSNISNDYLGERDTLHHDLFYDWNILIQKVNPEDIMEYFLYMMHTGKVKKKAKRLYGHFDSFLGKIE